MGLCELPQELIFEIATRLPRRDIIRFALKTGNGHIFAASQPLLKRLKAKRKHEDAVVARFQGSLKGWPQMTERAYIKGGYERKFGPYRSRAPNVDFLAPFAGSFYWLPLVDYGYSDPEPFRPDNEMSERVHQVVQQAAKLRLAVPTRFVHFMSMPALQRLARFGIYEGLNFCLDDNLLKCSPWISGGRKAHAIRFCSSDHRETIYDWHLLIEEAGHSIIRNERTEWRGIFAKDEMLTAFRPVVEAVDFEEWVLNICLSSRSCYLFGFKNVNDVEAGSLVEDYISHNFSKRGCDENGDNGETV